ncbi:hypothetical protein [Azospirillum argentinense]|uniref:hypothetical protein n=1 Tax=Azospirillum argentinense TaxID=2970906 RepID=UPI0032DFE11C
MNLHTPRAANFMKACYVLWLVEVERTTQTEAAIQVGLNVGTVNHIVHGRRFKSARPICPPQFYQ